MKSMAHEDRRRRFRAWIVRIETRHARLAREIKDALDRDGAFAAQSADGRMTIITQSLRDPSLFQVTSLTRDGDAWGHFDCRADDLAREASSAIGKRQPLENRT